MSFDSIAEEFHLEVDPALLMAPTTSKARSQILQPSLRPVTESKGDDIQIADVSAAATCHKDADRPHEVAQADSVERNDLAACVLALFSHPRSMVPPSGAVKGKARRAASNENNAE